MDEIGVVKEERRGVSWSLPMVEEGAGLLIEGRGGGFKQVSVGGKTPHRDKRKKLAAEPGGKHSPLLDCLV